MPVLVVASPLQSRAQSQSSVEMDRLEAYRTEKLISRGQQFSEVYQARHLESGTMVAIKKLQIFDMDPTTRKESEAEISLLQSMEHPNLIKYHEHFNHMNELYLVMELAAGGTLAQRIDANKKTSSRVEEKLMWRWLQDIAGALTYLHTRRVLHRDVKPSHIFLGENGSAKLGDFGLSKAMSAKTQIAFSCVGTPFYMSPEIVKGEGYSFGSDMWSLGCSLYEAAAGVPPFHRADMDFYALGVMICSAQYPELPSDEWSNEFNALIREILAVDPGQRPTSQRILDTVACRLVGRIQDFDIVGGIGRGKFSEVHRAIWKANGDREVAMKRVQIFEMDADSRAACLKEAQLLKDICHSTIIRYLDSFVESSELVIVLELAAHGDLSNLCRKVKDDGRTFPELVIWAVFLQICDALYYMHRSRMMHRDIKPANMFVCNDGVVKLGDLGLGRYFSSGTYRAHSVVGTPFYMSPEVITSSDGYSFKSDIWSMGCVLYELAALVSPFAASKLNFYALGNLILKGEYAPLPEGSSPRVRRLCNDMIKVRPDERLDTEAVFNATDEHFAHCWSRSQSSAPEDPPSSEVAGDAGRVMRQLQRAADVVREALDGGAAALPSQTTAPGAASARGDGPAARLSPVEPAGPRPAPDGGARPVRRSHTSEVPLAPTSARGVPGERAGKRKPPAPLAAALAPASSGERPARDDLAPHSAPSCVSAQAHRPRAEAVREHRKSHAGGSLSARGSSRDRAGERGAREARLSPPPISGGESARDARLEPHGKRAPSPGRGSKRAPSPATRRAPSSEGSHLRFAGGSISEGWKNPQGPAPALPTAGFAAHRGSPPGALPKIRGGCRSPDGPVEAFAERGGRQEPSQQVARELGALTPIRTPKTPPSSDAVVEAPGRRGGSASPYGADWSVRLPGATSSIRGH